MTLHRVAAVGPAEQAWVIEATIPEGGAIDRDFRPHLDVGVVCALATILLVEGLLPLVHLCLAFESIAVLGDDAEITITQVDSVLRGACDMYELVVVLFQRIVAVSLHTCLSRLSDQFSEGHGFLLIFPQQDLGEGDQEEAEQHQNDSMRVVSFVQSSLVVILDLSFGLRENLDSGVLLVSERLKVSSVCDDGQTE